MPVPPKGLIVDLVTPLHPDLSLDEAGLGRLVDRVISQADAILAGSPDVGEALELPGATRRRLLAALVAAVAGRVPLFLGITGHSQEETRELALAVHEDCRRLSPGAPVFLADLPLWYHSNRGLPQSCRRLLEEVDRPLVLLNLPAPDQPAGSRVQTPEYPHPRLQEIGDHPWGGGSDPPGRDAPVSQLPLRRGRAGGIRLLRGG